MAKKADSTFPTSENEPEPEAVPLAVNTRTPSDEELLSELGALLIILRGYSTRRQEYHHAAVTLDESIGWIRAAQTRNQETG